MGKKVLYGKEAREGLKRGLDTVANAVKVTMGAKGLPVAIDRPYSTPIVTKDGVSVAEAIQLEDPLENMGATMIIDAAKRTNDAAGDGTSTSVVLTQSIVNTGDKALKNKEYSFYDVKKGMEYAVEEVVKSLEENKIVIKDDYTKMVDIPTISANNDRDIGKLIADTFKEVGEYGFISVDESKSSKTFTEFDKGLKFKMYPDSVAMYYEGQMKKYYEDTNVNVLLYIGRIEKEEELNQALKLSANKHLLIICNEIDPLLLTRITQTVMRSQYKIKITVAKSPEFGILRQEAMEDIALITGARLFLQEQNDDISQLSKEDLGVIDKLVMDEHNMSFISSKNKELVEDRVKILLENLEATTDAQDKEDYKQRIGRLKGGVARIYVGGVSEMEMKEKKDRVVDAVNALTVAYKDGVVIGGGVALLNASESLKSDDENKSFQKGVEIVKEAIKKPIKQILLNAGHKKPQIKTIIAEILSKKDNTTGYNVFKEEYTNMVEEGILDPLAVTVSALKNALSISTVFLSTEAVLLDVTNWTKPEFADGI